MRETKTLEFKESVTKTFLKTVSAFANYEGGSILFGVDDSGKTVGVDDPAGTCLNIENMINDAISPQPDYSLGTTGNNSVIELKVHPGASKPYFYHSKAYKRNGTSTIEVDTTELTRLILAGKNLTFEQMPSEKQDLSFNILGEAMKEHVGLSRFDEDTLRTLNLLSKDGGYNNAAALLADANPFFGIDIALFGESISVIRRRETSANKSILMQLDDAMRFFRDVYCYEKVSGLVRKLVERIPADAFREAVANAIAHRLWDVSAHIRVAMFEDRVEVTSPGGLPIGITEDEYLRDGISVRRNPILANVLFRLGIIEAYGTGIHRIKALYDDSATKPQFRVGESSIEVVLPEVKGDLDLGRDHRLVYELLSPIRPQASSELVEKVSFSRSKLNGILKDLVGLDLAVPVGSGRGLKYRRG